MVKPILDGARRRYQVAAAEVGFQDKWQRAELGFAVVSAGPAHVQEVLAAWLQRSATADGTRPTGTIYYVRNGDVRSTTRHGAFPAAVAALKVLGVRAEHATTTSA